MLLWKFGISLLLPIATLQHSRLNSLSYIGAVAEYSPVQSFTDEKKAAAINAENYIKFIKKAAEYGADIIVFPESSLSGTIPTKETISYIPDPEDKIIPCNDVYNKFAHTTKTVSCAARKYGIYVVVNHFERVDCANELNCTEKGYLVYNTNVAFDRSGRVIARYRKYNLFRGEIGVNVPDRPEAAIFRTDFGVTFGTFICFDLLFQMPSLNLTRSFGVTDILYSTHWFSQLPFLYSVEAQAGWAYANDVNFLAAGYDFPGTASSGSGIYVGRQGHAKVVVKSKASNVLIVAEIPKVINGKRLQSMDEKKVQTYEFSSSEIYTTDSNDTGSYFHKTEYLKTFTTKLIDLEKSSHDEILCDRNLCCEFKLKLHFDESEGPDAFDYYRYRIAVFNGTRILGGTTAGVKVCGIIACIDNSLAGCGHLFHSNKRLSSTTFESIDIQYSLPNINNQNLFIMPISLLKEMKPLSVNDFSYKVENNEKFLTYSMSLKTPRNDLLSFAMFGRYFSADGSEATRL